MDRDRRTQQEQNHRQRYDHFLPIHSRPPEEAALPALMVFFPINALLTRQTSFAWSKHKVIPHSSFFFACLN
jgi:hypothetical protein